MEKDNKKNLAISRRTLLRQAGSVFTLTLGACGGGGSASGGGSAATPASATTPVNVATAAPTVQPAAVVCADTAKAEAQSVARTAFVHPGLLNTEAGFDRIRARVNAGDQPWKAGWTTLLGDPWSYSLAKPRPIVDVTRPGNVAQMFIDMQRTYELALIWKITGSKQHGDTAVNFLDTWSTTMKTLTGDADAYLAAGLYGYQWACAAEIMRTYGGWSAEGIARWQVLLKSVFYRLSNEFLVSHHGTENNITNYWANWDLISIAGVMAIGVFCDDIAIYEQGKAYFMNGRGNGAAAHMVYVVFPGFLGQYQESGRDQGHATLGIACLAAICEIAWNQGDDLYGYWNNRVLSAVEYVAASNLANDDGTDRDLPFARYANKQGIFTAIAGTARASRRPCFAAFHNHYVNRRGLSARFTTMMTAALQPEGRDATGDSPGLGTLAYSLPSIASGAAPSGVIARISGNAVIVDWWGTAYATQYRVERAATACGEFSRIGTVDESNTHTWTDVPPAATWFYRVTAVTPTGNLTSKVVSIVYPGELWFALPLNEGSGSQFADKAGRFGNSTAVGTLAWVAGRNGSRAPWFDGAGTYISMPSGVMADLSDFTLSAWVYLAKSSVRGAWLLNVSTSDVAYLALIPQDGGGKLRTLATLTTHYGEQETFAPNALPIGAWTHVALVLAGRQQTLYVNGLAVAVNAEVDVAPHQLGITAQNWIGRSSYAVDPFFIGSLQDLQIHSRAFSAAEVARLAI